MTGNYAPIEGMTRDEALVVYRGLVRRLARQLIARVPSNVEKDDLIQEGMIALLDCCERFDSTQGVKFETFATQRIRGAMLDYLRGEDYASRGDRRMLQKLDKAINGFTHINRSELAKTLGITLPRLEELLMLRSQRVVSADNGTLSENTEETFLDQIPSGEGDPLQMLVLNDLVRGLEALFQRRSSGSINAERTRKVFYLWYEGMKMNEIGKLFGVTESRICQLIQAIRNRALREVSQRATGL